MKRLSALCAAALIVASGSLAAMPVMAQTAPQTLNVQGADIRAFIQDVARMTGNTFIVDPGVTGTVTVSSQRALSRTELFEVFLSTLRANGLVVVRTGSGAYRVSPATTAAQQASTTGAEGFSTQVFQLRHIDASSAAEIIRPLVGEGGQVLANPQGNTVVVADFRDNLARVRNLIRDIDVDTATYEVVSLSNSSAREIAEVLNAVLAPPGGQAGQGMVSVTPVESSNSLVLRGDAAGVARVRPLIDDLDRRAESMDDIKVIFLEHASADEVLPVLQQLVGQTPTSTPSRQTGATSAAAATDGDAEGVVVAAANPMARANIARFPGANALVISGSPEIQRTLSEVIRQLDTRRQQVLVEAIVVELSDQAVKQLGVQWLAAGEDGNPLAATNYSNMAPGLLPLAGAIAAGDNDDDDPIVDDIREAALDSLLGVNGFIGGGGGRIGDALFGFILNAVKADANSQLLSTPSVMTLDNKEAVFLVGQEVPVTTGEVLADNNANPFRTTQRQDIGVKLQVTPQINAGGAVTLHIRQEVSSINGLLTASASDLVLNKREIETTLIVDDGDIAVAGGLLDRNERLSGDKVPGLGDLPVLGGLFRSTGREAAQTNLMIFIRPTIVRSPQDAQNLAADRWGYMRDRQIMADPTREPSLDEMVRDYFGTTAPVAELAPPPPPPLPAAPVGAVAGEPIAGPGQP